MVYGVQFPLRIHAPKPLSLLGKCNNVDGSVKTVMGVYLDPSDVKTHFEKYNRKGKIGKDILADDMALFGDLQYAEMEKVIREVVLHETKGVKYGPYLENSMRLAEGNKYTGVEARKELKSLLGFFASKDFKANSIITFYFSAKADICKIKTDIKGEKDDLVLQNYRVIQMMQHWFIHDSRRVSPGFDNCLIHCPHI